MGERAALPLTTCPDCENWTLKLPRTTHAGCGGSVLKDITQVHSPSGVVKDVTRWLQSVGVYLSKHPW